MSSSPGRSWWAHQSPYFTSFVRGWEETTMRRLHISRRYSTVSTGEGVESEPLDAGGHRWKLTYYPVGSPGEGVEPEPFDAGSTSMTGRPGVVLSAIGKRRFFRRAAYVTAWLTMIVLDRDGNLLCDHERCLELELHGSSATTGIWTNVRETATAAATVEESKADLRRLEEDALVVRCKLIVGWSGKESRMRWFLRKVLHLT